MDRRERFVVASRSSDGALRSGRRPRALLCGARDEPTKARRAVRRARHRVRARAIGDRARSRRRVARARRLAFDVASLRDRDVGRRAHGVCVGTSRESETGMMHARIEKLAPIVVAIIALLTGGAWLASHGGPPQYPGYPQPPQYPQQPQFPQQPPPYQPRPPETPPKSSGCGDCDCADCASACDGCDVGDCDVSGCGDCDCSGVDCTHIRVRSSSSSSSGLLVLLLPLALLDAWRRGLLRRA